MILQNMKKSWSVRQYTYLSLRSSSMQQLMRSVFSLVTKLILYKNTIWSSEALLGNFSPFRLTTNLTSTFKSSFHSLMRYSCLLGMTLDPKLSQPTHSTCWHHPLLAYRNTHVFLKKYPFCLQVSCSYLVP